MSNIKQTIKDLQTFIELSSLVKLVTNNLNNLRTADKNDLYDLLYCEATIKDKINNEIQDKNIKANLENILESIESLIASLQLNRSMVNAIVIHDIKNSIYKLNKVKYGNKLGYVKVYDSTSLIKHNNVDVARVYVNDRFFVARALMHNVGNWVEYKLNTENFDTNTLQLPGIHREKIQEPIDTQELLKIKEEIQSIDDAIPTTSGYIDYIRALVKAEILYQKYRDKIDNWVDSLVVRKIIKEECE